MAVPTPCPCSTAYGATFSPVTDDLPKKKVASVFRPPSPDTLAYLDFSVSTTGILAGVKVGVSGAAAPHFTL